MGLILVMDPKDWLTAFAVFVGLLGLAAATAAYFRFRYKDETQHRTADAITTWKELAEARWSAIKGMQDEKLDLERHVTRLESELGDCEKLRNDFAVFNLRLQAKNAHYEKCINRLEERSNLPLTNFDDPTPANFGRR